MATTYTVTTIIELVVDQMNKIKGLQTDWYIADGQQAYDAAVSDIGFGLPIAGDELYAVKSKWIIDRMRRWFYDQLRSQYALRFDISDLKANQIFKNLNQMVNQMDENFLLAKEDPSTAGIFINAANVFGNDMVVTSGFIENRNGVDLTRIAEINPAGRPKQPLSIERLATDPWLP